MPPWNRGNWHGQHVSVDGTPTTPECGNTPPAVCIVAGHGDEWDGTDTGVAQLPDGRWMSWETTYGPTGNGWSEDAYGGGADIFYAGTIEKAMAVISERGLEDIFNDLEGDPTLTRAGNVRCRNVLFPMLDYLVSAYKLGGPAAVHECTGTVLILTRPDGTKYGHPTNANLTEKGPPTPNRYRERRPRPTTRRGVGS